MEKTIERAFMSAASAKKSSAFISLSLSVLTATSMEPLNLPVHGKNHNVLEPFAKIGRTPVHLAVLPLAQHLDEIDVLPGNLPFVLGVVRQIGGPVMVSTT